MTDISPSTNNAPQIRQQHNSYPSPHSYPSPSMQPTYSYPPPQGQQASEQYRASPTGSNVSLPSLNLPPIRAIDGQSQPPPPPPQPPYLQQSAPAGQHQTGSPLPPPVANMSGYYPQQTHGMPNLTQPMGITSSPQAMGMRYPLPAQGQDQRIMSGGRHKKEIKRRTKTGCLTCRKRRIKVRDTRYSKSRRQVALRAFLHRRSVDSLLADFVEFSEARLTKRAPVAILRPHSPNIDFLTPPLLFHAFH